MLRVWRAGKGFCRRRRKPLAWHGRANRCGDAWRLAVAVEMIGVRGARKEVCRRVERKFDGRVGRGPEGGGNLAVCADKRRLVANAAAWAFARVEKLERSGRRVVSKQAWKEHGASFDRKGNSQRAFQLVADCRKAAKSVPPTRRRRRAVTRPGDVAGSPVAGTRSRARGTRFAQSFPSAGGQSY